MKLAQLIPIENCIINGYSLVENVFGSGIVVYDALGVMHTTTKNVKLLGKAQTVLEHFHCHDVQSLACALTQLREEADILEQADYDRAVWRDRHCEEETNDALALTGCLA